MNKYHFTVDFAELTDEQLRNEIALKVIERNRIEELRKNYLKGQLEEVKEDLKNLLTQISLRSIIQKEEESK